MRRRRLLIASLAALAGCTNTGYRATGPRTPPPAPETDTGPAPETDPVEARAQAVIRPLNELYRTVRTPLDAFEVDGATTDRLSAARQALDRAREALDSFSVAVTDPPARYGSLSTLVTAHESLLDALSVAVDLWSSLTTLDDIRLADASDVAERIDAVGSHTATLGETATRLHDIADAEPTVPPSIFLTVERMRAFATTLATQSMAIRRLVDATERTLLAATDWRTGVAAFDRAAFDRARTAFGDARRRYGAAVRTLDEANELTGSFADLADRHSCVAEAGFAATATALEAVEATTTDDVARAEGLLATAETTRNRCRN